MKKIISFLLVVSVCLTFTVFAYANKASYLFEVEQKDKTVIKIEQASMFRALDFINNQLPKNSNLIRILTINGVKFEESELYKSLDKTDDNNQNATNQDSMTNVEIDNGKITGTNNDNTVIESVANVKIVVNSKPLVSDVKLLLRNGIVYVPFRHVFEALGGVISVAGVNNKCNAWVDLYGLRVEFLEGSNVAFINGRAFVMDDVPIMKSYRLMIPVTYITEFTKARVSYNKTTKTYTITNQD